MRRKEDYSFLDSLGIKPQIAHIYKYRLNSTLVKSVLPQFGDYKHILEVTDIDTVMKICKEIRKTPDNIKSHNGYTSALTKYILYLHTKQS